MQRDGDHQIEGGALVMAAESKWVIQRCAADATSASLRGWGARLSCPFGGACL